MNLSDGEKQNQVKQKKRTEKNQLELSWAGWSKGNFPVAFSKGLKEPWKKFHGEKLLLTTHGRHDWISWSTGWYGRALPEKQRRQRRKLSREWRNPPTLQTASHDTLGVEGERSRTSGWRQPEDQPSSREWSSVRSSKHVKIV